MGKKKIGRPLAIGETQLQKLREGFLKGYNDEEACLYADVKERTFYDYCAKHPEFSHHKEQWKLNPILKAKDTIFENLDDKETAKWYVERKRKNEFSTKIEQTITNTTPQIVVASESVKDKIDLLMNNADNN